MVPLFVSLVALGGVVWSTFHNAKQSRAAEDRRAAAAIEAEDRRYEHGIETERKRRVIEARHQFYEQLESARRELLDALSQKHEPADQWPNDELVRLGDAVSAFGSVRVRSGLYGSGATQEVARGLWVRAALLYELLASGDVTPNAIGRARAQLQNTTEHAYKLQKLLRVELGITD